MAKEKKDSDKLWELYKCRLSAKRFEQSFLKDVSPIARAALDEARMCLSVWQSESDK